MKFLASVLTVAAGVALLPTGLAQTSGNNAKLALNSMRLSSRAIESS